MTQSDYGLNSYCIARRFRLDSDDNANVRELETL